MRCHGNAEKTFLIKQDRIFHLELPGGNGVPLNVSLPRGVSPRLECGHARALSYRAVAALSRFPSRGSRDQGLSLEAFPRGFHTGLSHVPPWCESILGLKVEAVQGKQVSLEWTEKSGGLWEWWHGPEVPLAFPVESASS